LKLGEGCRSWLRSLTPDAGSWIKNRHLQTGGIPACRFQLHSYNIAFEVFSPKVSAFPPSFHPQQKCAKNILTLHPPAGIMCRMNEATVSSYDTHNVFQLGFPSSPITY
jgi:hypothetical protein